MGTQKASLTRGRCYNWSIQIQLWEHFSSPENPLLVHQLINHTCLHLLQLPIHHLTAREGHKQKRNAIPPKKPYFSTQFLPSYPRMFPVCARCPRSVRKAHPVPWHRSCRELDRGNTAVSTGKATQFHVFLHIIAFITHCCHSEYFCKKFFLKFYKNSAKFWN